MKPSWKIRRRLVILTLIFCAGCIVYLLIAGDDTKLNETIALGVIGAAISTLGSYVFGAVWDDRNVMTTLGKDAHQERAYPIAPDYPGGYVG